MGMYEKTRTIKTKNMTEKTENKEQLFEQKEIEGTPFTAIKLGEEWFLTMGKYRLTEPLPTMEECIEASKDASWWRLMAITGVVVRESEEIKKLQEEVQKLKEQMVDAQERIVEILTNDKI